MSSIWNQKPPSECSLPAKPYKFRGRQSRSKFGTPLDKNDTGPWLVLIIEVPVEHYLCMISRGLLHFKTFKNGTNNSRTLQVKIPHAYLSATSAIFVNIAQ
jgi:hypothetical protein